MSERTDGRTNGRTDERTDGRTDERTRSNRTFTFHFLVDRREPHIVFYAALQYIDEISFHRGFHFGFGTSFKLYSNANVTWTAAEADERDHDELAVVAHLLVLALCRRNEIHPGLFCLHLE